MAKIDGLEIVMTKQIKKMIDKELKKRFEELKPELATRYEELLNMRNMEADQFNDGFNDARAGKLETDQPHYDLDTDNWRLGYAWGMFEPMKEKLARERQVSDAEIEELGAQEAERKEFCPNCEAETPCTHEAELFVCDICGEDFAKYIVLRNCNLPDVLTTQDVLTDVKTPRSIENNNPDYYKDDVGKWIPVSERLPEKQKLTIGFTDNSAYVFFEIVNDDEMGLVMYPYQNRKGTVTHWMPLPSTPEVQE